MDGPPLPRYPDSHKLTHPIDTPRSFIHPGNALPQLPAHVSEGKRPGRAHACVRLLECSVAVGLDRHPGPERRAASTMCSIVELEKSNSDLSIAGAGGAFGELAEGQETPAILAQ